jgi:cytoskeletal protein CcmA (bactofilin family)
MTINTEHTQTGTPSQPSTAERVQSSEPVATGHDSTNIPPSGTSASSQTAVDRATIGKSLRIKGEVIGSESLYIDSEVEGVINLPDNRITVGRDASVSANITAREVVVFGKVTGDIFASERVEIRSEGSLTRNITTQRISIDDGGFFRGSIDHHQTGLSKKWDGLRCRQPMTHNHRGMRGIGHPPFRPWCFSVTQTMTLHS